jgi:hypothetical protein
VGVFMGEFRVLSSQFGGEDGELSRWFG